MITSNLNEGTAYLKFIEAEKSDVTLPIDDAFVLIDRVKGKVVGFEFDVNKPNDWVASWDEYKPDFFQSFLKDLTKKPVIRSLGQSFVLENEHELNLEKVAAAAYVDVNAAGDVVGLEFLFKS